LAHDGQIEQASEGCSSGTGGPFFVKPAKGERKFCKKSKNRIRFEVGGVENPFSGAPRFNGFLMVFNGF
jgi:hypothetical protein